MAEEQNPDKSGDKPRPIGPVVERKDLAADMGRLVSKEADAMPAILYLETATMAGETPALRDRYSELRDRVIEAGNEGVLSLDEYCLFSALGELLSRGRITTSLVGKGVPKRYLPKREAGESKAAFVERQAAAREQVHESYSSALRFIMRPGVTEEGIEAMQAEVLRRMDPLERDIRAAEEAAGQKVEPNDSGAEQS